MSEEKKNSDSEAAVVGGYFNSLIEDFSLDHSNSSSDMQSDSEKDRPRGMRDFSKFFNDAAASGSGFQSTIDKEPDALASDNSSSTVDFNSEHNISHEIIKEPVTDDDGMIVIYDQEAGIDAIGFTQKSKTNNSTEQNFEPDLNISDDVISTDNMNVSYSPNKQEHKSFIRGIIPWKGDSTAEIVRKIVFLASTGVFAVAAVMLLSTLSQSQEMQEQVSEIEEKVTTTVATSVNSDGEIITIPPTSEERESHAESVMNDFISISGNVKGFIEIPSCGIYLPVVQGTDNDYYLTHTYDDRKNKAGAIFIDYRCTVTEEYTSPNVVLYGHNQEDGTMFGNLKYFKNNVDFYRHSPIFSFSTEYSVNDYVIFGYFVTNVHKTQDAKGEVFHYHDYIETLKSETTFYWYMNEVNERNQIISPVDVVYGDELMVLSTCSNEYSDSRFVVLARKLRDGESASKFDFSSAQLNPNAKQIDWDIILSRESVETTTTTEETTTVTTTETTTATTTETTTEETTVPTTKQSDSIVSKLSLAPQYHNGTTASIYSETTLPENTDNSDNSDSLSDDEGSSDSTQVPEESTEETSSSKTGLSLATQVSANN